MGLTVETGAGLATADAMISLAAFKAYCDARGIAYSSYSDTLIEQAIRRASSYMSNGFGWAGSRSHARDQALAWPRAGVTDRDGNIVPSDSIPAEVASATSEITVRELASAGAMTPDFTASGLAKREKIGDLEVEYALSSMSPDTIRPVLLIVNDLIGQFISTRGASASIVGVAVR